MRVITPYPVQTPVFSGKTSSREDVFLAGGNDETSPTTKLGAALNGDSFGYVSGPSLQETLPITPFAVLEPVSPSEMLANRVKTLLDDPIEGRDHTKALLDAASDRLPKDRVEQTPQEREALNLVQAIRQLDTRSKISFVQHLSGGSDTAASQLASQALRQNRPVGLGDFISAWRNQPHTPANTGFSNALSVLGSALLSLQIVAPASMLSPTLMNGAINSAAVWII